MAISISNGKVYALDWWVIIVVRWVTTSEYSLLYVFRPFLFTPFCRFRHKQDNNSMLRKQGNLQ